MNSGGRRSERGAANVKYWLLVALCLAGLLIVVPKLIDLTGVTFDVATSDVEPDG